MHPPPHPPAGGHGEPTLPDSMAASGAHHAPPGLSKDDFLLVILLVCFMCIVYVVIGTFFKAKKSPFGHETGLVILLGVLLSYIFTFFPNFDIYLNDKILFQVCLPLILFSEGYNMHMSFFYQELTNSLMFGFLVVFATYFIHLGLTWASFQYFDMQQHTYDLHAHTWGPAQEIRLELPQMSVLAAVFSSIDLLSVMPQVPNEDYKRVHNILLGQGLFCDVVAVLLVMTTCKQALLASKEDNQTDRHPYMALFPSLVSFFTVSVAIGVMFGVLASLMLKHCRSLSYYKKHPKKDSAHEHSEEDHHEAEEHENEAATHETFFMLVTGIATYAFGDYVKYSGVCSIITTALVIKTYGYPSLTAKGKKASAVTFKMLGYMSEVIIFGMIGFGFFQADNQSWSWHLVLN
jgi:NhaP-type Na+/H+ or K+/H+ antiporter